MTPRAIVSGASVAGLSAAYWLRRIGWQVTVIEKADSFRSGGQNVDLRGVAHDVLDRMGLTDAVKALNTTETGTVIVDDEGRTKTELPSDGPDSSTAELEILRGDLAEAIRDHLPDDIEIRYGDRIAAVDGRPDDVQITTEAGYVETPDLLVVAEGVRSTTRDLIFGDAVEANALGITMAFGTITRTADDDSRWRWYNTVGGRQVHLRPDNHGTTRAILAYAEDEDDVDISAVEHAEAMSRLRDRFADAGWQAPRVLDGFDTSSDVYIDRLTQITMPTWHRGRVCLAGDAAWCVTPLGGGGASLALTSGYVLAAYLLAADEGDFESALTSYESWLRPVVDSVQKLPPGTRPIAYPQTMIGLKLSSLFTKAMASKPLEPLMAKLTNTAGTEQPLPELREDPTVADQRPIPSA